MLTRPQIDQLLQPINPRRVMKSQGQSHVAAFDVAAHLTRIFGFGGWEKEVLSLDLVSEYNAAPQDPPQAKGRWTVTYRCLMRLTIRDPEGNVVARIDDGATGSSNNLPLCGDAHDFAMKNAISYALKRCAKDLGDQFGLSLYNKGATGALIGRTLVLPGGEEVSENVEEHAPAPESMGNDERQEPTSDEAIAGDLLNQLGTPVEHKTGKEVAAAMLGAACGDKDIVRNVWANLELKEHGDEIPVLVAGTAIRQCGQAAEAMGLGQ